MATRKKKIPTKAGATASKSSRVEPSKPKKRAGKARPDLASLRTEIDAVDQRIVGLIGKRARLAQAIGERKRDVSRAILDVGRERDVLRAVIRGNKGPLSDAAVEAVFREIISACRASEEPTTVAYLGPEGTFTHEAAIRQFGRSAVMTPVGSIPEVFTVVESGRASFGVVPIENTTEGAVTPTLDALADTSLHVIGEVAVGVDQYLMAQSAKPARLRRIASHPQALAQCRRYLADNYPRVEVIATPSTTAAAKMAAAMASVAAIASPLAASLYGLEVMERSIQDNPANVTRFLVIGKSGAGRATGQDRTSLVVLVQDQVGILERIIRPFSRNGVNLSMIESRPILGRPWEYRFFIDVSGHLSDAAVEKALVSVRKLALSVKVLGSYPIAG